MDPIKEENAILLRLSCFVIFLVYFSPYFILGSDTSVVIHDNLDSNVALFRIVASDPYFLNFSPGLNIEGFMNGIPRSCLPTDLHVIPFLYRFFPPFTAYTINLLFIHGIAFFGMLALLRLFPSGRNKHLNLIRYGASLCFALLPFFPTGGLAVAGLPMVAWAFASIWFRRSYLIPNLALFFFAFYSSLVWSGFFILLITGVLLVIYFIRFKKIHVPFMAAIVLLAFSFVISEIRLIQDAVLSRSYTPHRVEFDILCLSGDSGFVSAINQGFQIFLRGQEHTISVQFPLLVFLAFPVAAFAGASLKRGLLRLCLLLILAISLFYGLMFWKPFLELQKALEFTRIFDLKRFYFFLPLLWFLSFFLALASLPYRFKNYKMLLSLISIQLLLSFYSSQAFKEMIKHFAGRKTQLSFKEFYDEPLFAELNKLYGHSQANFISLGVYPGVLQYNGIHTADGYPNVYPVEHKRDFRKIIARELDKDPGLKSYYDCWGSRCYVFSAESETDFVLTRDRNFIFHDLHLDPEAMKQLQVTHLVSAGMIEYPGVSGLELERRLSNENSVWDLYIYKVK